MKTGMTRFRVGDKRLADGPAIGSFQERRKDVICHGLGKIFNKLGCSPYSINTSSYILHSNGIATLI
jgi:hypothetical protein